MAIAKVLTSGRSMMVSIKDPNAQRINAIIMNFPLSRTSAFSDFIDLKPKIKPYGKKEPEKPKQEKPEKIEIKMTEEEKKVNEKVKELLGIKQEKLQEEKKNETR